MDSNFKNLFNINDSIGEEPQFDENGQEIIDGNNDNSFIDEIGTNEEMFLEFDENGKEIIKSNDLDNGSIESACAIQEDEEIKIYFAELNSTTKGILSHKNNWVMHEENSGAFFIYSKEQSLDGKWILLVDSNDEEIIWESAIITIPNNIIQVGIDGQYANYMTKKAIYKNNMPEGDNLYFAKIEGTESPILALNVISADEELSNETYEDLNCSYAEASEDEISENMEIFDIKVEEETLNKINFEMDELPSITEDIENIKEDEFDINKYILESYILKPESEIKISDFQVKDDSKISGEILIEKLGNKYTAIFNGFGNGQSITLLEGEKPYFEFNYGIDLFLEKVYNMLTNMLGYSKEKIEGFKKVLISDEEYIKKDDNLEVILRKEAVANIAGRGINLMYINKNYTYLSFIKEKRRIEVYDYIGGYGSLATSLLDMKEGLDVTVINDNDSNSALLLNELV